MKVVNWSGPVYDNGENGLARAIGEAHRRYTRRINFREKSTWEKAPDGKIQKPDVSVAKNYLTQEELDALGRIVNAYLELAEERAIRKIPMTMEDWAKRLDAFLEFTEHDILQNSGEISANMAKSHAESEFEKYRIVQDRLFESDFDREMKKLSAHKKS